MGISIDETPKVNYFESESNPKDTGEGAQIPIFIGISGNTSPKSGIQKFKSFEQCNKTVQNGGLGTDTSTNPLLAVLKGFFKESRKIKSSDITVPYVYVIDLGTATVGDSDADDEDTTSWTIPWLEAMELAKSKRDIQVESYVGFKKTDEKTDVISIWNSALASVKEDNVHGNPRICYSTILNATDSDLKEYTDDSETLYIQDSRFGLIAPDKWGEVLAKIVTTPYYEEPGYTDFRSINPGEFDKRTPSEEDELQNAGIIFIKDELAGSEIHPRINLAVSTAFAANPDNRTNDSLLHSRRNVDQLIREVFIVLFNQIKRNETEINLSFCQTDVNVVVDEKIDAGYMMEGTEVNVVESESNPIQVLAEGVAVPVNSTLLIGFSMYIDLPNGTLGGN